MENSIKFNWYKTKIPTKRWNEFYSKIGGYTYLGEDDKETWVGFLAVIPPEGCLEITNMEELIKIQMHREISNRFPMPFIKK